MIQVEVVFQGPQDEGEIQRKHQQGKYVQGLKAEIKEPGNRRLWNRLRPAHGVLVRQQKFPIPGPDQVPHHHILTRGIRMLNRKGDQAPQKENPRHKKQEQPKRSKCIMVFNLYALHSLLLSRHSHLPTPVIPPP